MLVAFDYWPCVVGRDTPCPELGTAPKRKWLSTDLSVGGGEEGVDNADFPGISQGFCGEPLWIIALG